MANEDVGRLLNEVGSILAKDAAYPLDGTFLYAEAESQMVDMSIFKDVGDRLVFRWPMQGLSDVLLELWEAEDPENRWAAMQYHIEGGKFDASFIYGKFDPTEPSMVRRERILRQRYNNKRVDYPSLE